MEQFHDTQTFGQSRDTIRIAPARQSLGQGDVSGDIKEGKQAAALRHETKEAGAQARQGGIIVGRPEAPDIP